MVRGWTLRGPNATRSPWAKPLGCDLILEMEFAALPGIDHQFIQVVPLGQDAVTDSVCTPMSVFVLKDVT